MWATIVKPFAWLMLWLYKITSNYGIAILLFALVVNVVLTPFQAKSKKGMMRVSRLQPRMQEIQRRHEGNPQKLQQEMQKLYKEEGASPTGGCIWSLIPFPILIALYSVIRQPLTRMMYVAADKVTELTTYCTEALGYIAPTSSRAAAYAEINLADFIHQNWDAVIAHFGSVDHLVNIDFGFLGMNLGDQPDWQFLWSGNWSWAGFGLFLIPFISAGMSWASMKISQASNPQGDPQQAASMKSMNLMMPLMSVWICFIMPGAMGIYWIGNSLFAMIRDYILTKVYTKQLDKEDAERIAARSAREKELEEKRLETERLRAEGKTEKNNNTSKKKIQANEKQKSDERKAALDKADRAARRERLGIKENELPPSQVGNRRYARGRAYVPDRFTNPENAEAATELAAAESEDMPSIDETMEEVPVTAEIAEAAEETVETVTAAAEETAETVTAAAEEASEETTDAPEASD